jgi:putative hemolysin
LRGIRAGRRQHVYCDAAPALARQRRTVGAFYQNIGHVLSMLVLLCLSAFFSGSETAYFNLSRRQVQQLRSSEHRLSRLAADILTRPRQLLGALLLGNMTVNVLYYAASSVLVLRVEQRLGLGAAAVTGAVLFAAVLLFGEIFPKTLAYANSRALSVFASLAIYVLTKILRPVIAVFQMLIVTPALRLLIGSVKRPGPMSADEFRSLMERIRSSGYITAAEHRLVGEIVGLNLLKVRHCLRPRVDMTACDVTDRRESVISAMRKKSLAKLPVYHKHIDNIIGFVYLRDLLVKPQAKVSQVVRRAQFVPEQKTIESLLEHFRQSGTDTAVVVDEYGGIAGTISLEDVAEEIFGPIEAQQAEPIEQIGPLKYRLAGDLALHDWAQAFGVDFLQANFATIGGLVTWLLGRIPRQGDTARLKNLNFTVESVQKNRVQSVILALQEAADNAA